MNCVNPILIRQLLLTLGIVAVIEFVLMMTVDNLLERNGIPGWGRAIADAALLAAVSAPFLWYHYVRPLREAYYDALTDLPNRTLFKDRLELAMALAKREGKGFALIFMDMDHFKAVNDTHGHQMGDQLLELLAARLRRCVRESDTVARLGGDEFTVILPGMDEPRDAEVAARKIIAEMSQQFVLNGHTLHLEVSLGIAFYPDNGSDGGALLNAADHAMYRAKAVAGSSYCLAGLPDERCSWALMAETSASSDPGAHER